MRITALVFLTISSALAMSGCGNGTAKGNADGGGPDGGNNAGSNLNTQADFESALAAANCQYAARCGSIAASAEKQCEIDAAAALMAYPPAYDVNAAIAANRLKYDPVAARACIDAFKTAGCTTDQNFGIIDLCQTTTPLVAVGGSCMGGSECVAGYCDLGAHGSDGCPGTCKAFTATGAACDPKAPHCAATDFCDSTAKKCTARLPAGGACGANARCQSGLFCNGYVAAAMNTPEKLGVCGGTGKAGDGCQVFFYGNTSCTPGLYCDDSLAAPTCAARLPAGMACATTSACVDGLDCIGLDLDMNTGMLIKKGACAAFLALGAACDPTVYETGCSYDAACESMAKVCSLVGPAGADCSQKGTGGLCGSNLYCDSASMKCTPMVAFNKACTPPVMVNGMPGADPCHDGSCGAGNVCALVCM